jgi:protein-S-isoprenylcysteine O-methyltransferase Ste14
LRGWAAGHLAKNQDLATSGPYAYMRNPLYVGTLLVAAGLVIAARQWTLAVLFTAVFVLIYLPVIELEEQHLRKLFPTYSDYAARVPLLLPRGKRTSSSGSFRRALYMRNQEYQALIGYLVGLGFLVWKAAL